MNCLASYNYNSRIGRKLSLIDS